MTEVVALIDAGEVPVVRRPYKKRTASVPLCPQPVHIAYKACPQPYTPKHTVSIQGFAGLSPQGYATYARLDGYLPGLYPRLRRDSVFNAERALFAPYAYA
jgi:hypothetical protein